MMVVNDDGADEMKMIAMKKKKTRRRKLIKTTMTIHAMRSVLLNSEGLLA